MSLHTFLSAYQEQPARLSPSTTYRPCSLMRSWWQLQVAEHIPAQHEQTFLENVYRHAALGVVLSWAVPGQVRPCNARVPGLMLTILSFN